MTVREFKWLVQSLNFLVADGRPTKSQWKKLMQATAELEDGVPAASVNEAMANSLKVNMEAFEKLIGKPSAFNFGMFGEPNESDVKQS